MKKGLLLLLLVLIGACTNNQPIEGNPADEMTVALHQGIDGNEKIRASRYKQRGSEISKALVPGIKVRAPVANAAQRRFDIAVKDVPARTVYMGLVANMPISLAVSPEITQNVSLNLKQVTVEQVLQTMENLYGFVYEPIPGGFEILPNKVVTKIYAINYLELERRSQSSMTMSSGEVTQGATSGGSSGSSGSGSGTGGGTSSGGGSSGGSSGAGGGGQTAQNIIGNVQTQSKYNFWNELEKTLCNIVGAPNAGTSISYQDQSGQGSTQTTPTVVDDKNPNHRSVTVNPLAGAVVVRATPRELKQVEAYLDIVQNSIDRQVILEAKILEITLSNQYQMGIDWKLFGANLNALRAFPGTRLNLEDFPDAFSITAKFNQDFTATIRALELQGNVQVLSSPKVATMNNQMSAIKVGTDEFFVTNINTNNTTSTIAATGTAPVVVPPTPSFTPFFSGITLDVTPQVDSQNNVTLHIHPAISLVKEQTKTYDSGVAGSTPSVFPFARSTIRESDTIVHAKNRQVIVIGGLMENQSFEDIGEMPFFANIPFLGTLLRNTKQEKHKTELVILLRPTVVNIKSNNQHLIETTQRFAGARRGYHIGGRPDIFGTEGEVPVVFGPASGQHSGKR